MKFFKSHFRYNKSQRNGIFFLLLSIVLLQFVFFYSSFISDNSLVTTGDVIANFQYEMDSLRKVESEQNKIKIYPFNPNYISDYKGYQLGMSIIEIDRLKAFRAEENFVNSSKQFQEVTGISDSLHHAISPFFKFPDWIKISKSKEKFNNDKKIGISLTKKDINLATANDFKKVKGIGDKLSARIVNYRTKLQGFSMNDQLFEVWNLDEKTAAKVLEAFEVIEPPKIKKININTASFKEILAIVYLDYETTKKILQYKTEVAEIQAVNELKKIDGFPLEKFDRIALYLQAK